MVAAKTLQILAYLSASRQSLFEFSNFQCANDTFKRDTRDRVNFDRTCTIRSGLKVFSVSNTSTRPSPPF
eukprot:1843217-Pleurochrysis_carterae.AAC.1